MRNMVVLLYKETTLHACRCKYSEIKRMIDDGYSNLTCMGFAKFLDPYAFVLTLVDTASIELTKFILF